MSGVDHPLSAQDEFDLQDATVAFIQSRLNVHPDAVGFRKGSISDVTQHAFVRQQIVRTHHASIYPDL